MSEQITDIPLNKLTSSELNMRKSETSKADNEKLRSSIKSYGIKQNLIVFPGSKKGVFEVVAGQRRYTQAQILADQKHLKKTHLIPCQIAKSKQEAIELSIIENTHRAAAHPADEFEAYNAAKQEGSTVKDISERFGVTQRHVKQRLKLADVAPEIIQRFRQGKMTQEVVTAFTIEPDHARQLEVLAQTGPNANEHQIKKALTNNALTDDDGLVKFVGLADYKKAGGSISTDLFSTTTYIHDNAILEDLAQAKLNKLAEEQSKGWLWFEVFPTPTNYNQIAEYSKIQGKPSEKLTALQDKLETENNAIYDNSTTDELTDDESSQSSVLDARLEDLEIEIDDNLIYDPEEKILAGFIVCITRGGTPEFTKGLVRNENLAALKSNKNETPSSEGESHTAPNTKSERYSQSLTSDLSACRQAIAQGHLALSPKLALDVLQYSFCIEIFDSITNGYNSTPLSMSANRSLDIEDHEHAHEYGETMAKTYSTLSLEWTKLASDTEKFKAYQKLNKESKANITAYCTASSLQAGLKSNRTTTEAVIDQLAIPWGKSFNPTKANFLSRISKPTQIEIGKEFMPETWADDASKKTKAHIAEELEIAMSGKDERLDEAQTRTATSWLPEGFE